MANNQKNKKGTKDTTITSTTSTPTIHYQKPIYDKAIELFSHVTPLLDKFQQEYLNNIMHYCNEKKKRDEWQICSLHLIFFNYIIMLMVFSVSLFLKCYP